MLAKDEQYIQYVINLAVNGVEKNGGGPFGAVVVKDGIIIGEGNNSVTNFCDPTAHAEVVAIRNACETIGDFQLTGCTIYSSCEPCPMCFGAIYWARPDRVVFAADKQDAARAGFDDEFIYSELDLALDERRIRFDCINHPEKMLPFKKWNDKSDKIVY